MLLTLPDGRRLEIDVSGPPDGVPLLFHHGTPGSSVPVRAMQRAASARGLRLVTYSRAGYGESDRHEGRAVVDVVADVEAVLDSVGAQRCVVAGWSGGGPHALACGARLASRVAGVLSIAGVGPYGVAGLDFLAGMGEQNIDEFGAALAGPDPLRAFLEKDADELRAATPEQIVSAMSSLLPDVDRAVITDEYGEDLVAGFAGALRHGVDGWLDDDLAFTRPWGFELAELRVPTFIWQGSADLMVPFAHGQWLASTVPGATVHLLDGEGHLSIGLGALDTMLDELVGGALTGSPMHDDEIPIDVALVRALVQRSLPELAGRSLHPLPSQGSSNALFRLGDDLLVRLPRQPGGSATIRKEARWLPVMASSLPVAVPSVMGVYEPGLGYPEHWSVVRLLEGDTPVGAVKPHGLAAVIAALRGLPVPSEALSDPDLRWYRGDPLRAFDARFRGYLADCRDLPLDLDLDACGRVWDAAVALPGAGASVEPRWLHGDLAAENLLVDGDRLVAVLDFGGLSVGNPAVDLAVAWEVLSPAGRVAFRDEVDVDDADWALGRAWALALAIMTFPYYWHTIPDRCAARLATARAVLADAAGAFP